MSFAVAPDGTLVVLDQINGRLARYDRDGKRLQDIKIQSRHSQDVAIGADGTTLMLDRLKDKNVTAINNTGRVLGSLPVDIKAVGEPAAITGLFVDGKKVYVEVGHGELVHVGSTKGEAAADPEHLIGRPSRDGTLWLSTGIINARTRRILVSAIDRATRKERFRRKIHLDAAVL